MTSLGALGAKVVVVVEVVDVVVELVVDVLGELVDGVLDVDEGAELEGVTAVVELTAPDVVEVVRSGAGAASIEVVVVSRSPREVIDTGGSSSEGKREGSTLTTPKISPKTTANPTTILVANIANPCQNSLVPGASCRPGIKSLQRPGGA